MPCARQQGFMVPQQVSTDSSNGEPQDVPELLTRTCILDSRSLTALARASQPALVYYQCASVSGPRRQNVHRVGVGRTLISATM